MSEQDKEEDMAPRSEDDGEEEGDDETDKVEQPETDQRPSTAKSVIFRKTVAIFMLRKMQLKSLWGALHFTAAIRFARRAFSDKF